MTTIMEVDALLALELPKEYAQYSVPEFLRMHARHLKHNSFKDDGLDGCYTDERDEIAANVCEKAANAIDAAATLIREQREEIARLNAASMVAHDLWDGWRRECDDADKIITEALHLHPDAYRTQGGSLNVPYIINTIKLIQEK